MQKDWREKLQEVMAERGLKAKPLSKAAGLNETYLRDVFEGHDATIGKMTAISDELGLPLSYFFSDERVAPRQVPVVGYAAGGEEWTPIDSSEYADDVNFISLDLSGADPIAIRVRGPSMSPVFRDGDDLICSRQRGLDMARAVNQDCVVRAMDGRCYVKLLLKGATRNTYRLRSYNRDYDDIDSIALDWVAPVIWIRRRT